MRDQARYDPEFVVREIGKTVGMVLVQIYATSESFLDPVPKVANTAARRPRLELRIGGSARATRSQIAGIGNESALP